MLTGHLPLDAEAIAARLPHGRALCLLDRVVAMDERCIRCEATSHRAGDNPLRVADRLGAACAVEYAAQAMAVHGAWLAAGAWADADTDAATPERGLLLAVRDLTLAVPRLDDLDGALHITCERLDGNASAASYRFDVAAGAGIVVARGRAMLMRGDAAGSRR